MGLSEQWRPKRFEDCVGQQEIVKKILRLNGATHGLVGNVLCFLGSSGAGKTTLGRLCAAAVAKPWSIEEVDSQDLTFDAIREFEVRCRTRAIDGSAHVVLANEFHTLRKPVIDRLKTTVETPEFLRNGLLVLTSTIAETAQKGLFDDEDAGNPFFSRAHVFRLETRGEKLLLDYAVHLRKVAQAASLDGRPLQDYMDLVKKHRFNLRACLNAIERGELLP